MKEDLTELILNYREAIRHLWNAHAQYLDGEHRFKAVEEACFHFSVLCQVENAVSIHKHPAKHYYKFFKVVPVATRGLVNPLIGKPNAIGGYDFDFIDLSNETDLELRLMELYDLQSGFRREYQYVMCYIINADNTNLKNNVVLIDCEYAQYDIVN